MRIDQDHVHTTKEKVFARRISGFPTCAKTAQRHAKFVLQVSQYVALFLRYEIFIYDATIVARHSSTVFTFLVCADKMFSVITNRMLH